MAVRMVVVGGKEPSGSQFVARGVYLCAPVRHHADICGAQRWRERGPIAGALASHLDGRIAHTGNSIMQRMDTTTDLGFMHHTTQLYKYA